MLRRKPAFFGPLLLLAFLAGMFAGFHNPVFMPAGIGPSMMPIILLFNTLMGGIAFSMAFSLACIIVHAPGYRRARKTAMARLPDELRDAMRKGGSA